jgi:hypothetical protein
MGDFRLQKLLGPPEMVVRAATAELAKSRSVVRRARHLVVSNLEDL